MNTVLKLGGELLEGAAAIRSAAAAVMRLAQRGSVLVVHGGGRAIDADLRARGLSPRFADGLRVTDAATLDSVISVLAGRANTSLVAAIGALGGRAVGLTGADARLGLAVQIPARQTISGEHVDLGLVGEPIGTDTRLIGDLLRLQYVPVVASVGVTSDGNLLNINADTFAAHLASVLQADRLIVAGTTPGVLDGAGATIPQMTGADIRRLTESGTAHSGMIAKLVACRQALTGGVREVSIVAGRGVEDFEAAVGTRVY